MSMVSLPLSTAALVAESWLTVEYGVLYQITVLQPSKLFGTHVLMYRLVVSNNAFAICSRLFRSIDHVKLGYVQAAHLDGTLSNCFGELLDRSGSSSHSRHCEVDDQL